MAVHCLPMTLVRGERSTQGAVYVEFLIAFMPVFVFFLALIQLSLLFSTKLLVDHSSVQGARAAAVVFGDEPGSYDDAQDDVHVLTPGRRQAVRDAVLVSLAPAILDGSLEQVNVAFPRTEEPGGKDQPDDVRLLPLGAAPQMLRVRVEAEAICKIALVNMIICKQGRGHLRIARIRNEALYPYQGARYVYE
jgi:TadE-like protein